MTDLIPYNKATLQNRFRRRDNETKLGERVGSISDPANWKNELRASPARFVLLGIPEDIGVRANYGRSGAASAWNPVLTSILNVQSTPFFDGAEMLVLGHVFCDDLMQAADLLPAEKAESVTKARELTAQLDERVYNVIHEIIAAGKIPVVIGGGHNNAFPIINATAKATQQKLSVINCDAHSDYRTTEGRHSGNGFRYASEAGALGRYAMVGLHENYTPAALWNEFDAQPEKFNYSVFESIFIRRQRTFEDAVKQACTFAGDALCGIELDLDSVENIPSSARTSSGISANDARYYVTTVAATVKPAYLHLCEAAPVLAHRKADIKTGKLMAYLVTDFMKAVK